MATQETQEPRFTRQAWIDDGDWTDQLSLTDLLWIDAVDEMGTQFYELGSSVGIWVDPWEQKYLTQVEQTRADLPQVSGAESEAVMDRVATLRGVPEDWRVRPPLGALTFVVNDAGMVTGEFCGTGGGVILYVGFNTALTADPERLVRWSILDPNTYLLGFDTDGS